MFLNLQEPCIFSERNNETGGFKHFFFADFHVDFFSYSIIVYNNFQIFFYSNIFFKWGRFVPGTLCSRGRFVAGTLCGGDALWWGRFVAGTLCGGDAL